MLKIDYYREATRKGPEHWLQEILDFRQEMAELIDKNPGLKGQYAKMFAAAWKRGSGYACRRLAEYDRSKYRERGQGAREAFESGCSNGTACCPPNAPTGSKT